MAVRDVQKGYDRRIKDQIGMVNIGEVQGVITGAHTILMRNTINDQSLGFEEFKREVIESDRAFRRHLYEHKRNTTSWSPYSTTQSTMCAEPSHQHHQDDMDIHVNQVDSQGNRQKCCDPAKKGCWGCGKEGHQHRNCPETKTNNFKQNDKKTPTNQQSRIRQLSEVLTCFSEDEMDNLMRNGLVPNPDHNDADFQ